MSPSDAEDLFPPRVGGMVESARAQAAQAAPAIDVDATPAIGYPAVRVQQESPERFAARNVSVPSAGSVQLLGQDPNRKRATLIAVTAGVVLAGSRVQADGAVGATLPTGVALVVEARGELWAAGTGTATAVAVISELYTPKVQL